MASEKHAKVNGQIVDPKVEAFIELLKRAGASNNIDPQVVADVVKALMSDTSGKGLSDEDLERITGHRQGVIRRALRLLHDLQLASYRRGRHPETKATRYYWSLDADRVNIALYQIKRSVLGKLKARLKYEESNEFFICPRCGIRYSFNEAFEYDFTCPRCGSLLVEFDNRKIIETLRSIVRRLEEEIKRDEEEIFSH
ncbi:transcription initiation factor IIE subunit alpha [Stetteria hydrogenophila]